MVDNLKSVYFLPKLIMKEYQIQCLKLDIVYNYIYSHMKNPKKLILKCDLPETENKHVNNNYNTHFKMYISHQANNRRGS